MARAEPFKNVLEVGIWLNAIELGGRDQRAEHRPANGAAVGSCKQMVLAAESDGADGALDGIIVDLDAAVVEEPAERRPARAGVADSLGEGTVGWYAGQARAILCWVWHKAVWGTRSLGLGIRSPRWSNSLYGAENSLKYFLKFPDK